MSAPAEAPPEAAGAAARRGVERPAPERPPPPPAAEQGGVPDDKSRDPDKGFGGWLKSKKNEIKAHTKEIRENAHLIAQDIARGIPSQPAHRGPRTGEERLEFTFMQRALGLELDLREGVVRAIKPGGQAESLLVQVMDRLVAIDGDPLPEVEDGDQFIEMLKQRMQSMPRPVTLTFARACILPDEEDRPEERDQVLDMVAKRMPALGFGRAGEAAEASELRELAQRLEAELQQAREELASSREDLRAANADAVAAVEEAASLRADLADLQLSRVWGAQDARPADDDAERGPPVEGTEPQRLAAELESAARQRAALERALATAQQEEGEQRAEASASAARAAASEALLAELRAAQEELRHQARQAREELEAVRAQGAEEARRCAAAVAAAEEPVRELKRMLAASQEEVAELKSREAAAKARASAAGGAAEDALADAERHRARALAAEGEAAGLRAEAELLRAAAADAEARRLEAQRRQGVANSAAAAAAEAAEVPPAEAAVLILDELGDDVDPRVRELLARVHELEGQKSVLSRQLSERPIVYQFGPDENDPDINDEYDVEAHAPDGASRGLAALSIATICCVVLAVCWRCIMRSLVVCRRQKPTQLVEKSLRHFTRSLLKRPLLLWLFYLHVMVLWAMEGWRQAALNSAAHQSPAAQIDRAFQAAARTEAP